MDAAHVCQLAVGSVVAAVAVGIARALARDAREKAIRAQDQALDAVQGCVACGEPDVAWLGEGVYLCGSCGYEGGEGYGALQAERRRAALLALPEAERSRRAAVRRDDARALIASGIGALEGVRERVAPEVMGADPRVAHAWEQDLLRGLQEIREGLQALDDARILTGGAARGDRLQAVEPRRWYLGELGAEVDGAAVRQDVDLALRVAREELARL